MTIVCFMERSAGILSARKSRDRNANSLSERPIADLVTGLLSAVKYMPLGSAVTGERKNYERFP